jgi:hypothetical protein
VPVPLDELPVWAPLSMAHMVSNDPHRTTATTSTHDRTGDVFLITGLGVYPNLGS